MSKKYEKLIYLSILSEQCGRYEDMMNYMEEFVKSKNEDLSVEERILLFDAYKGRIWSNYQILVKIKAKKIVETNKGESPILNYLREYKNIVDKIADELCNKINNFIDINVIPKSNSDENKSFYYQNKGNFWKFLVEYGKESNKSIYSEKCLDNYYKSVEFSNSLDFKNNIKLKSMYELAYFLHEIAGKEEEGFKLMEEAYTKGKEALKNFDENDDEFADSFSILRLIEDNYYCWKED
jgi:14-3-3 protein epsilon